MGEKFIEWSDNRFPLPLNTILSLTSFYWFTNSFGRGMWAYSFAVNRIPVPFSLTKPFGYSSYHNEVAAFPRAWAEHLYPNLVLYKAHDKVSQSQRDATRSSHGPNMILLGWSLCGAGAA